MGVITLNIRPRVLFISVLPVTVGTELIQWELAVVRFNDRNGLLGRSGNWLAVDFNPSDGKLSI